jgi:hypothetical protein
MSIEDLLPAVAPRVAIDLRYTRWDYTRAGLRAVGTWRFDLKPPRPCMVLLPAKVKIHPDRVTPVVIDLDDAWKWTEEYGDPEECAILIMNWFAAGFLPGNPANTRDYNRVFNIVRERLNDLLMSPPAPARNPEIVGDMTITYRETGTVQQKDIVDDV